MSDEKSSFQPGEKIGDYEVVSVLGFGATGTVYLAQHTVLKKLFAVKVLSGDLAFMPEFVRVFQHEAQIVAALNHENIVPVHNFGEFGGFYYYVMDFVNGGTLEDIRRRNGGRLRPEAAIPLIVSVARGLAYAHGYGVVHRDLKPENILLTRAGTPQITDFGMAYVDRRHIAGRRRMEERRAKNPAARLREVVGLGGNAASGGGFIASQTQISIEENAEGNPELEGGTEGYIAPEVARGNAATPRADVYALGALLHFLLVGETPSEPGVLSPEIFKLRNRALTQVLKCSLSLAPSRRYPTAKEFLEALERVESAPVRRRRGLFYALGAVAFVAAFAVVFVVGERSQLRKTENRVVEATQKFFEKDPADTSEGKTAFPQLTVSADAPAARGNAAEDEISSSNASVAADAAVASSAEAAEREYWERFCAERTGRRGFSFTFSDEDRASRVISAKKTLSLRRDVPAGTYNIYLRTDGETSGTAVPVRFSIGENSVSRVMRFGGEADASALNFFSIIDVSAASEHVRIEVPPAFDGRAEEIGVLEIELRPTFSNADFSRMFGEFLSVISEK